MSPSRKILPIHPSEFLISFQAVLKYLPSMLGYVAMGEPFLAVVNI